ncbi:MAG: 30S ribosomal protein S17 [Nitrospinae bacterium]|nr:30S ribosomal protein S17 [Nitrospinota bacterium]
MSETQERGYRKVRVGVVVSDKMDKTAVVKVERRVRHSEFGKIVTRSKRYYVHDEKNELKVGDKVKITETRPMSALKRWRISAVIARALK